MASHTQTGLNGSASPFTQAYCGILNKHPLKESLPRVPGAQLETDFDGLPLPAAILLESVLSTLLPLCESKQLVVSIVISANPAKQMIRNAHCNYKIFQRVYFPSNVQAKGKESDYWGKM